MILHFHIFDFHFSFGESKNYNIYEHITLLCMPIFRRAITWLCEKPTGNTAPSSSVVGSVSSSSGAGASSVNGSSSAALHGVLGQGKGSAAGKAVGGGDGAGGSGAADANGADAAAKLQREKDHKEELRRINRAWNSKAEDEKRKVIQSSLLYS